MVVSSLNIVVYVCIIGLKGLGLKITKTESEPGLSHTCQHPACSSHKDEGVLCNLVLISSGMIQSLGMTHPPNSMKCTGLRQKQISNIFSL